MIIVYLVLVISIVAVLLSYLSFYEANSRYSDKDIPKTKRDYQLCVFVPLYYSWWRLKAKLDTLSEDGFTLIEFLIVFAIVGILAAIAVPQFKAYQNSPRGQVSKKAAVAARDAYFKEKQEVKPVNDKFTIQVGGNNG